MNWYAYVLLYFLCSFVILTMWLLFKKHEFTWRDDDDKMFFWIIIVAWPLCIVFGTIGTLGLAYVEVIKRSRLFSREKIKKFKDKVNEWKIHRQAKAIREENARNVRVRNLP